jgi:DNA-binding HxlR family transcriptional regulator
LTLRHSLFSADCQAVGEVLSLIGDKWTVLVVNLLGEGPKRFNEMKREIGRISQRMLTLTLRALERDGLVIRTVYPTLPPSVEYRLTELGQSLRVPLQALGHWAVRNQHAMAEARRSFDAAGHKSRSPTRTQGRRPMAARAG